METAETARAHGHTTPAAPQVLGWQAGGLWSPSEGDGWDRPQELWASVSPEVREEQAWILNEGSQFSKNGNLLKKFANEVRELVTGDRRIQPGTLCRSGLLLKTSQWMAPVPVQ